MQFEAEHRFEGSRDLVWEALHDPAVLSRALPGNARVERSETGEYVGEMTAGVGPVTAARFDVKVALADEVPPAAFTMNVDGRGAAGFVQGSVRVELDEEGPSATVMRYRADLQVGGRIAGVGQRLLDTVGKGMARQSLSAVNEHIRELQAASVATGEPVVAMAGAGVTPPARRWPSRPVVASAVVLLLIILAMLLL